MTTQTVDLNQLERDVRASYVKAPVAGFDIARPKMALVYRAIADALEAVRNCERTGNADWRERHRERIAYLVGYYMPSGSGFDSGTQLDADASRSDCLVFNTAFHHMDAHGCYDGWTEHTVRVRPAFGDRVTLTISGRDRNGIKDVIAEAFQ